VADQLSLVAPSDGRPTLYVTNWSSVKLHGPGRQWTIMARPRSWERGDGYVLDLAPYCDDLDDLHEGFMTAVAYKAKFTERLRGVASCLTPGNLHARPERRELFGERDEVRVEDGDTLCCACGKRQAAEGWCHRVWAAEALVAAGWRVILDGRELEAPRG
jgi:hypothetical protein